MGRFTDFVTEGAAPATSGAGVAPAPAPAAGTSSPAAGGRFTQFVNAPDPISEAAFAARAEPEANGPIPSPAAALAQPDPTGGPELQAALDRKADVRRRSTDLGTFSIGDAMQTGDWEEYGKGVRGRVGSALEGMSFGHRDELSGLLNAVFESIKPGGKGWSQGYTEGYDRAKGAADEFGAEHPAQAIIGEAGGVAATLPAAGLRVIQPIEKAPGIINLATRLARAGVNATPYTLASGALMGSGATERDAPMSERLENMREGGNVSAGINMLAAGAGGTLGGIYRGARRMGGPVGDLIRTAEGLIAPKAAAERMIGQEVSREPGGVAGAAERMAEGQGRGVPMSVGAAGGEAAGRLARTAADASSEAGAILKAGVAETKGGQSSRMEEAARRLLRYEPGSMGEFGDRLTKASRDALEPAYEDVRAAHPEGIINARLADLVDSPLVKPFLIKARDAADLEARVGRGTGAMVPPPPGSMYRTGAPTIDFWDQLQRQIRGKADQLYRAGNEAEAGTLRELRRQVLAEVDAAVPEFKNARGIARHFFGAEDALDVGKMAVRDKDFGEREALLAMRDATPEEKTLLREGFLHGKIEQLSNVKTNRSIADPGQFWNGTREERVARVLLGDRDFAMLDFVRNAEAGLNRFERNVTGRSDTAQRLWKRLGVAGGIGGIGAWLSGNDPRAGAAAGVMFRLGGIPFLHAAEERTFRRMAQMLLSNDPAVMEAAARRVAGNPRLGELFRRFAQGAQRFEQLANGGND